MTPIAEISGERALIISMRIDICGSTIGAAETFFPSNGC